ncbi:MAG: hypothetical protein ACO1OQ_08470 [Rufibacter sp.]
MPPTFIYILGFIVYLFLSVATMFFFGPLLFVPSKREVAKKALVVVLISFPCLLLMSLFWTIILGIPGALLIWLFSAVGIPLYFLSPVLLVYVLLLTSTSLYLWYLVTKVLWARIEGNSVSKMLEREKLYQRLKTSFQRLKNEMNKKVVK